MYYVEYLYIFSIMRTQSVHIPTLIFLLILLIQLSSNEFTYLRWISHARAKKVKRRREGIYY